MRSSALDRTDLSPPAHFQASMASDYFHTFEDEARIFEGIGALMERYESDPESHPVLMAAYHGLVAQDAFRKAVRTMLARFANDPDFSLDWITTDSVPIIANTTCSLSLQCLMPDDGAAFINAAEGHQLMTLLSAAPLVVDLYKDANSGDALEWEQSLQVVTGSSFQVQAGRSFKIHQGEHGAVFAKMVSGRILSTPLHDAGTGEFLSMTSLSADASRWSLLAEVAGQLRTEQAVPILLALCSHAQYNVRWTALQALFSHDLHQAMSVLDRYRSDENDSIREEANAEWLRIRAILDQEGAR